jgi:hypothetical protein
MMFFAPVLILGAIGAVVGIFFALKERAANRAARQNARSSRESNQASRA